VLGDDLHGYPLLAALASMTETARHDLFGEVLAEAPHDERQFWLWELGNAFMELGYHGLAASVFVRAALVESTQPITRAALLVKAGAAGTDGSLGSAADQGLVNAVAMLEQMTDKNVGAARLVRSMAHYAFAQYYLFLDAYSEAGASLDRAVAALDGETLSALGVDPPADDLPDVLRLRARITRGLFEMTGEGSLDSALDLIDRASSQPNRPALMCSPFVQSGAFQRGAILRLRREPTAALAQVELACRELTGLSVNDATVSASRSSARLNRYRLGYLLCLAGEIWLDHGTEGLSSAFSCLAGAATCWTDPYYGRGLSRAKRLYALALMREGQRWSEASRLLTESIAHARGRSIVCEARAVASKVSLHRTLHHVERAAVYEAALHQIRESMQDHWPVHRVLDALMAGDRRSPVASRRDLGDLKTIASEHGLWGEDPRFLACLERAQALAKSARVIFIDGETGTGKSELARFIHALSGRGRDSLTIVRLATITESLVESELFGHQKNAFTGATALKKGWLEAADNGTLFLDDVSDVSVAIQGKLLGVLEEESRVTRVGDTTSIHVKFCLVCATNKDLRAEVEAGRFREDLYYRIIENPISLPPLRERGRDIVLVGQKVLESLVNEGPVFESLRGRVKAFSTDTWDELCGYRWEGNIRQLRSAIRTIVNELLVENASGRTLPVNERGEVLLKFVRLQMERQRATLGKVVVDSASERDDDTPIRLDKRINMTPEDVRRVIRSNRFSSKIELARAIRELFPKYPGKPETILKQLTRERSFARVLGEEFPGRKRRRAVLD
jgi:transcriptional regulator with GAF, ATPase, and Fis domain